MQKRISYFDVTWNRSTKVGEVFLTFDDRSTAELRPLSLEEMSLVCNLLRAEKPVFFDARSETLSTLPDRVGESG